MIPDRQDYVLALSDFVKLYHEDFLSKYQRSLLRRDVARARLLLYRERAGV